MIILTCMAVVLAILCALCFLAQMGVFMVLFFRSINWNFVEFIKDHYANKAQREQRDTAAERAKERATAGKIIN